MSSALTAALAALAALALLGAAVGCDEDEVGEPTEPTAYERALERAAGLGDAQLAGQRIVTGFEGESAPAALRKRIAAGRIAGVILFEDNFDTVAEAGRLAAELQAIERPRAVREPLLVMVDQEGGLVARLPGPPARSAAAMGAAGEAACAEEGTATGRALADAGINVDLAPVLDVARPGSAIETEGRSFGADPELVAACAEAFASGLERSPVAATAKHFPGLGAGLVNTDDALQRIELSRAELRRTDLVPYEDFLAGGAPGRLVMLSSAIYTAYGERPAAFTAELADDELRRRLGFEGVAITDALETASTAAFGGPTRAAQLAAGAGTDLMLFTSLGAATDALNALRPLAARDRAGFEAAVARVLALRDGLR